jgi:alkanesulfonate monooxygenase SsuD/methylene tetrahydromethanopterin reductase-like flavin-dependent oxidoreductase (luciferase family)
MRVEFGAIDHIDRQNKAIAETYDSRLKLVKLYDQAGFSTFHLTEHHFTPLGLAPSPLVFLAAASQITERIRFAPLVLIATLYNPLRLASEICMLDHLTHGRFEIGTGRGVSPLELGFYNVRESEAAERYREAMEVLMAALTQDEVDYQGKYFRFSRVPIEIRPLQRPHPPLWYATNSPDSAARAARQQTSIVTLLPSGGARKVVESYKESWKAAPCSAGSQMPKAGITRHIYVGENDRQAEERGLFGLRGFFEKLVYLWKKYDVSNPSLAEATDRNTETLIAGTAATVREKIEQQLEETGANYFAARFAYGDLRHEESVRSLELFTNEVMPYFRS